jgi:hypothetical protein
MGTPLEYFGPTQYTVGLRITLIIINILMTLAGVELVHVVNRLPPNHPQTWRPLSLYETNILGRYVGSVWPSCLVDYGNIESGCPR